MPTDIAIVVAGFIAVIGGVAYLEFKSASPGRKGRAAVLAASGTTAILCALLVLAIGYEWLAGPANSP